MKKLCFVLLCVFGLCGATDLAEQTGELTVKSDNGNWDVSMRSHAVIRAYNPEAEVELSINISDLLPNSPQCVSIKRIKDIKFTVNIYKIAQPGDTDWAKSFEQMRIRFYGPGRPGEERKPYGSNLVKNNLKAQAGQAVNIGTLQYLSPYTCNDVDGLTMRFTDMKAGGRRALPPLEFKIETAK